MSIRLAIVQHGDYADALRQMESGKPADYFGMYYSVGVIEKLLDDRDFLMVNIDATKYRVPHRKGTLVGLPRPGFGRVGRKLHPWLILREIRKYRPTHLLVRTGGTFAVPLLEYAVASQIPTAVIHAGYMSDSPPKEKALNLRFAALMNDPTVFLAGNHRVPATESMVALGVKREKVFAYDWPGQVGPDSYPAKPAPAPGTCHLAFVGTMVEGKGIADVVDAVIALNRSGLKTRLTACGAGPVEAKNRDRAKAELGDLADFPGRVPHDRVLEVMASADLVVVPSRLNISEGLPFTATEALACRTPLIASDHPSLAHLLKDGEGMRFFKAGDPDSLARVIREVMADPAGYAHLSETTAQAFARLECPTSFHELFDRWTASW